MLIHVLSNRGPKRIVFSTSVFFSLVFLVTAGIIVFSVAVFGEFPFFERINFVALIIIGICLFAALYLERWIFDKTSNRFERNVGMVFLHSHQRRPLDALQKVVLQEPGVKYEDRPRMMRWMSRRAAMLSVVDREGISMDWIWSGVDRSGR